MTTPEILAASQVARDRVEEWILNRYPEAKYLIFHRESDHGEWHNYVPDVYDTNFLRLNPKAYKELDGHTEEFYNNCAEDWDGWCNNNLGNGYEFGLEIGVDGIVKKSLLPPKPPKKSTSDDKVYIASGIFAAEQPGGKTVAEYKKYVIKTWQKKLKPEQLYGYQDGKVLEDDEIPKGGFKIEFFRRVMEKWA